MIKITITLTWQKIQALSISIFFIENLGTWKYLFLQRSQFQHCSISFDKQTYSPSQLVWRCLFFVIQTEKCLPNVASFFLSKVTTIPICRLYCEENNQNESHLELLPLLMLSRSTDITESCCVFSWHNRTSAALYKTEKR